MVVELRTYVLLLVEDNPADISLIEELLDATDSSDYHCIKAESIKDALSCIHHDQIDVILLDLQLPDSMGIESVKKMRAAAGDIPIVVLTGTKDEDFALACIDAGAQDYLLKDDLRTATLRRTIGYAISRQREAQVRDLQHTLNQLRGLSSATARTTATAMLAGTGAVRERYREAFEAIVGDYLELLKKYLEHLVVKKEKPRDHMEFIITRLGDMSAGPRDLMDVHVAALDAAVAGQNPERGRSLAIEGRLFALEMMGLLVDFYRVGQRRRFL